VAVAVGYDHAAALDAEGRAWAWGRGGEGQLGDGAAASSTVPVAVRAPSDVAFTAIAAGSDYTVAIDAHGRPWAWGSAWDGRLGNGRSDGIVTVPEPVSLPGGVVIVTLAGGGSHVLALDAEGRTWGWGRNVEGQVGDPSGRMHLEPTRVRVDAGVRFVGLAAGMGHSMAVDDQGRLWGWGWNRRRELGDADTPVRPVPAPLSLMAGERSVAVAAGGGRSMAVTRAGDVWAWGGGDAGPYPYLPPTRLPSLDRDPPATVVTSDSLRVRVHGRDTTVAGLALDHEGALSAWLQLDAATAFAVVDLVMPCRWTSVAAGGWGVAAIDGDGELWFWYARETPAEIGPLDGAAAGARPDGCLPFERLPRLP
jgi:alpha-tubulin suppressor-like RCC1 family protein